jgi:hypothetical protein
MSSPARRKLEARLTALRELDRRKCAGDPVRFVERHCTIEEPDGTVIPFTLWPFQRPVLQALQAGDPVIVLKARRLGLSWVVLSYALWLAVFQQGTRILVLCKTEADATELLDRIRPRRPGEAREGARRGHHPRRRIVHDPRARRHAGRRTLRDRGPGHR